ncbi:MAG: hypothetical protein OWQ54_01585 [Sulfolobaceae archaeon]|nr:hypothetical protein [Sulfolobaceae archaeon]
MRIAIPSVILLRKNDYTLTIAVIPPIITEKNADKESKAFIESFRETMRIEESCKSVSDEFCYTILFGGVNLFKNGKILRRFEVNGYVEVLEEKVDKEFDVMSFIRAVESNELNEKCYSFNDRSICFHGKKCSNCKWIDNIGLRVLVD